jgi:succinyl-CoA synthetase alpha subunit
MYILCKGSDFMTPELFQPKNIIIQGITGAHGKFHTKEMKRSGTNIVAGTSPNKAGQFIDNIPVYDSIVSIQKNMTVDATVIFVPAPFAKNAILEAITASIPLIVCITEDIPIHDMISIYEKLETSTSKLVGPNCPGLIGPTGIKLGIIPYNLTTPGSTAIVSRSGTLTYEATAGLTARGIGQRYIIGIGGDRIHGIGFVDCLKLFEADPEVSSIVLIGEIGGKEEIEAANYIKSSVTKPVFSYVTGLSAPKNIQLGHAGAILESDKETADYKLQELQYAGVTTTRSITELINSISV